jgi:acetolactate synthase small subunit
MAENLGAMMTTFLVEAEDKPHVLARVVMLFHRRAIVILSFSMRPTEHPGVVRMAITVQANRIQAERTVANLYNLVNILSVEIQNDAAERIHKSSSGISV